MEADHEFLLAGDVFTPDVIETWITMKRAKDIAPISLRPHPYEFFLYYDAWNPCGHRPRACSNFAPA